MTRYFTHSWTGKTVQQMNEKGVFENPTPLDHTAGNQFTVRGVAKGDMVHVVSVAMGQLSPRGKLQVGEILESDREARGMSRTLLKFSGGSGDDYAT